MYVCTQHHDEHLGNCKICDGGYLFGLPRFSSSKAVAFTILRAKHPRPVGIFSGFFYFFESSYLCDSFLAFISDWTSRAQNLGEQKRKLTSPYLASVTIFPETF